MNNNAIVADIMDRPLIRFFANYTFQIFFHRPILHEKVSQTLN